MKFSRRNFFGFMGGAAVAGPSVVKKASEMVPSDLKLPVTDIGDSYELATDVSRVVSPETKTHYAKVLTRLIGLTPYQKGELRRRYPVYELDVNVATLRSVNLGTKIRMSRDILFEKDLKRQRNFAEGILSGLFIPDDE